MPATQRAIWDSFHDALAAVHRIDPTSRGRVRRSDRRRSRCSGYWRERAARRRDGGAWRRASSRCSTGCSPTSPPSAEEPPAVCMGDARLVNGVIAGSEVRALVDFEVAYVGNPAADVGYSLFFDRPATRGTTERPLPGMPSEEETWSRWSGPPVARSPIVDYWTAFGADRHRGHRDAGHGAVGPGRPVRRGRDNLIVPAWEVAVRAGRPDERGRELRSPTPTRAAPLRSRRVVVERVVVLLVDRPRRRAGGLLPARLLPNQGRAMLWCYVHARRRVARRRREPVALRRLRPHRRLRLRPVGPAVRMATRLALRPVASTSTVSPAR